MKPLVIRLTEQQRAELERRRAAGGYRSLNETVQAWLAPEEDGALRYDVEPETALGMMGQAIMDPPKIVKRLSGRKVKGFDPKTGEPIYE